MKKTALTFVAVAFGTCVAFAQTTPQAEKQEMSTTEQSLTIDKMSNKPEEAGRRTIQVVELPVAVQTSLSSSEFDQHTVLTVTEVQPEEGAQPAVVLYEVALVEKAAEGATEPSAVLFFDEKGKVVSHKKTTEIKIEE